MAESDPSRLCPKHGEKPGIPGYARCCCEQITQAILERDAEWYSLCNWQPCEQHGNVIHAAAVGIGEDSTYCFGCWLEEHRKAAVADALPCANDDCSEAANVCLSCQDEAIRLARKPMQVTIDELRKLFNAALRDATKHEDRADRLATAIDSLCWDGTVSASRAREIHGMSADEQRETWQRTHEIATADRERLDWFEKHQPIVSMDFKGIWEVSIGEGTREVRIYEGGSLREALDIAIEKESDEGDDRGE